MSRYFSILGLAVFVLSAPLIGAVNADAKPKQPTVCYEQGCTGDRCIFCER